MSDDLREELFREMTARCVQACVQAEAALAAKDDEIARLREEIARLRKALEEIAKGEGRYSRDPLTHASNVIDNLVEIARAALRGEDGTND